MRTKLERRRRLACNEYENAMDPECGGDGDIYWDEVNEKLVDEGLPPFTGHAEMMEAIREEMDARAAGMKAMFDLLNETGSDSLDNILNDGEMK